jgi:hypothetical protein
MGRAGLVAAFLLLILASADAAEFPIVRQPLDFRVVCTSIKAPSGQVSCDGGYCSSGKCSYFPMLTGAASGYCACQETTTTTLRPCSDIGTVKTQRECMFGYCPGGGVCGYVPVSDAYGVCGCPTTTTTTLAPPCRFDRRSGKCAGVCGRGYSCAEVSDGFCGCVNAQAPSTSTTTVTLRLQPLPDVVGSLSTSTTFKAVPDKVDIAEASLIDSDKDGVPDIVDKCPGTAKGVKVNEKGCPLCIDSDADSASPHFEQGTVQLPSSQSTSPYDDAVSVLNMSFDSCANETHLLEGYCDAAGSRQAEAYLCPQGCYMGACRCAETDGGVNFDVQGLHGGSQETAAAKVPGLASFVEQIRGGKMPKMYAVDPAAVSANGSGTKKSDGLGSMFQAEPVMGIADSPPSIGVGPALSSSLDGSALEILGAILAQPVAEYCLDDDTLVEYSPQVKGDRCTYPSQQHVCPQGCRLGRCMPADIYNEKNASLFDGKEAFMVSDNSWRAALQAVPLTTWDLTWYIGWFGGAPVTFNFDISFPLLVYHRESAAAWDADAVIHFLQLYSPKRLTVLTSGEGVPPSLAAVLTADNATSQTAIRNSPMNYSGPGLRANQLTARPMSDYFGYWSTINSVVVSQDDYATGMLAAVWASHLNAPLVFDGRFNANVLNNRHVITVGDISPGTMGEIGMRGKLYQSFTRRGLQERIVSEYSTNRVILVNTNDLSGPVSKAYSTDKNSFQISSLFYKDSLAAAYLAAARNEVIIQTTSTNWATIDSFVESEFSGLGVPDPGLRYLTIVSSPNFIPLARTEQAGETCSEADWLELDGRSYGTFGTNMRQQTLATGRLFGLSVSDTSSLVAKSVHYSALPRERKALIVVREDRQPEIGDGWADGTTLRNYAQSHYWTVPVRSQFTTTHGYWGHANVDGNTSNIQAQWPDKDLIIHVDHGNWGAFCWEMTATDLNNKNIYFGPAVVLDLACETCKTNGLATSSWPGVNCVQHIRRGAVSYMGATDVSYWHNMFDNVLTRCYVDGWTVGRAYLEARNQDYDISKGNFCSGVRGDPYYALIGDPLFAPRWW